MMPWDLLLGSVTGFLGTIWTTWNQRKMEAIKMEDRQNERAHEVNVLKAETEAMIKEAEMGMKRDQVKYEGLDELARDEAFKESLTQGNKETFHESWMELLTKRGKVCRFLAVALAFLMGLADIINRLVRPILTAYNVWLVSIITLTLIRIIEASSGATIAGSLDLSQKENVQTLTELMSNPEGLFGGFSVQEAKAILTETLLPLINYLAATSVVWWFGERLAKHARKAIFSASK